MSHRQHNPSDRRMAEQKARKAAGIDRKAAHEQGSVTADQFLQLHRMVFSPLDCALTVVSTSVPSSTTSEEEAGGYGLHSILARRQRFHEPAYRCPQLRKRNDTLLDQRNRLR